MKANLLLIAILSMLFNSCSAEPRIVVKPCVVEKPLKPHRADFKGEFEYLKAIFKYAYDLEFSLESCD